MWYMYIAFRISFTYILWIQTLLQAAYKGFSSYGHQRALVERVRKRNFMENDFTGLDFCFLSFLLCNISKRILMLFFFGMFKDEKYYLRSLGEDPRKVRILNVKQWL